MNAEVAIIGIAGFKNAGKTTLVSGLVSEFTSRGFAVSTVKHAHHGFDIDQPGRDSFRHRDAGAREVAVVSDKRWALMHELDGEDEPRLDEVVARLAPCDLVIVEGYKREAHPKIEVRGPGLGHPPLWPEDETIIAIAAEPPPEAEIPVFGRDDIAAIADFIATHFGLGGGR